MCALSAPEAVILIYWHSFGAVPGQPDEVLVRLTSGSLRKEPQRRFVLFA